MPPKYHIGQSVVFIEPTTNTTYGPYAIKEIEDVSWGYLYDVGLAYTIHEDYIHPVGDAE